MSFRDVIGLTLAVLLLLLAWPFLLCVGLGKLFRVDLGTDERPIASSALIGLAALSTLGWIGFVGYRLWAVQDEWAYHAPAVAAEDQRSYEELRGRGYSERDAREAAPSAHRLCQQSGGENC